MEEFKLDKVEEKKGGKIVVEDFDSSKENEFKVVASNGAILCTSLPYRTAKSLLEQIDSLKTTVNSGQYFVQKDKNGSYQFKLYSLTGRCVVVGEAYSKKQTAISAANSLASFVAQAERVLPSNLK